MKRLRVIEKYVVRNVTNIHIDNRAFDFQKESNWVMKKKAPKTSNSQLVGQSPMQHHFSLT